jgi:transcriptional regulator with XRE-family HTH domain
MDIKSIFGENLKFYRKAKHLSQEQLSEKVDISVKHLSSIERGLTFVSADLLEKLALSVEIPVFCFFINKREIFYSDTMLNTIDRIIEKHLIKTIEEIKSDIRQNNEPLPNLEPPVRWESL